MAYQEVHITDLKPGSYVIQVLEQRGDIIVKHAGWVRTRKAIDNLRDKGVQVVLIDPEKQLLAMLQPEEEPEAPPSPVVPERLLFSEEQPRAEKILHETVKVQQKVLSAVKAGRVIDLSLIREVSAGVSESVSRNQDVLLCLNRIAEYSDSLLQHSVSCAVYIAAFARALNLPVDQIQTLITAALLHDAGKSCVGQSGTLSDAAAIPATLMILQRTPQLSGEVSLWISQHCTHLDGSGIPRLKDKQIEKGSRMLAIVNRYEILTSPLTGKASPLAASRTLLEQTPHQLDAELLQLFIKCIGIYPPGTVVKLSTGKLALVLENNPKKPVQPKVKVFYHSMHQHHIPPRILDLSRQPEEQIEGCADLKKYGLDVKNYL